MFNCLYFFYYCYTYIYIYIILFNIIYITDYCKSIIDYIFLTYKDYKLKIYNRFYLYNQLCIKIIIALYIDCIFYCSFQLLSSYCSAWDSQNFWNFLTKKWILYISRILFIYHIFPLWQIGPEVKVVANGETLSRRNYFRETPRQRSHERTCTSKTRCMVDKKKYFKIQS